MKYVIIYSDDRRSFVLDDYLFSSKEDAEDYLNKNAEYTVDLFYHDMGYKQIKSYDAYDMCFHSSGYESSDITFTIFEVNEYEGD